MNCPKCGQPTYIFVNGLFECEAGHKWAGSVEPAISSLFVRPVPITIRGVEYSLTPNTDKNYMLLVALIAINDPDVDNILRAFGVVLDIGGRRVFPPEE